MKIFVTGASGFIGRRLVEKLCNFKKFKIIGLVHRQNNLVYKHPSVTYIHSDILDKKSIFQSTAGINIIIHCAYGNTKDANLNRKITIEGTKNILEAAKKNNIKKIIYLSTAAVYETVNRKTCSENIPYIQNPQDLYVRDKIKAEKLVWREIKQEKVNAVILQPTIVYGPRSKPWAIEIIRKIREGRFFIPPWTQGLANFVYIDDVVKVIILAITDNRGNNQKFIISGQKPILWQNVFQIYMKIYHQLTKKKLIPRFSKKEKLFSVYKKCRGMIKLISPFKLNAYQNQCTYSIRKAQKVLGYEPATSFQKGVLLTKKWIEANRKI